MKATKLTLIQGKKDIPPHLPDYLTSTKLVMPEHLNPAGNLFGGQMMAWMDKIAGMLSFRVAKGNAVTASVSEINFKAPVHVGDQVELTALLTRVGNSSMNILVKAEVYPRDEKQFNLTEVADAQFTFIKIGENGKPAPIL